MKKKKWNHFYDWYRMQKSKRFYFIYVCRIWKKCQMLMWKIVEEEIHLLCGHLLKLFSLFCRFWPPFLAHSLMVATMSGNFNFPRERPGWFLPLTLLSQMVLRHYLENFGLRYDLKMKENLNFGYVFPHHYELPLQKLLKSTSIILGLNIKIPDIPWS